MGPRNEIGLCNNGHTCCQRCFRELQRTKTECPVCRSTKIALNTSHYVVNGLFAIISAITLYPCKFQGCTANLIGNAITEHELHCPFKLLKCPKAGCTESHTLQTYLDGKHYCIEKVHPHQFQKNQWHMTINLQEVFSMDAFRVKLSNTFKPKLLTNPNNHLPSNHLFINTTSYTTQSMIFFLGCLEPKTETTMANQQINCRLNAFVYTKEGKVAISNLGRIIHQDDTVRNVADGLYINNGTLIKWIKWTQEHTCSRCPNNPHPHMHFVVSFH